MRVHPAVTATGCVALWNVLQHSEQARAIAKGSYGYAEEGVSPVGMLRDSGNLQIQDPSYEMDLCEGGRGRGGGTDKGRTMVTHSSSHSNSSSGGGASATLLHNPSTSSSSPSSSNRFMVETISAARTALHLLMESER